MGSRGKDTQIDMHVDIAVIGAGLSGIAFSRFYLDTHPQASLLILEQDCAIGGVWSHKRTFDYFWIQSPLSHSYLSDVPLEVGPDVPMLNGTFPAKHVAQYFEEYVDSHVYEGRSIRDRTWCNAEVKKAVKRGDSWILDIAAPEPRSVCCKTLIVATGITSIPIMPLYLTAADCPIKAVHHRDFGGNHHELLGPGSPYQNFTVIGGGKSAADMLYSASKAGKRVNWFIRKSNSNGPGLFIDPSADYPFDHVSEGWTRAATALTPSAFHKPSPSARAYHHSEENADKLMAKLLAIDTKGKAFANYRNREGALPGFNDLEPTIGSLFWDSAPVASLQHPDFWDVVAKNVRVYRGDVRLVDKKGIHLEDGRVIPTEVALCGTGWSSNCPLFTPQQAKELGLPHDPNQDGVEETKLWQSLMQEADEAILEEFPILKRSTDVSKKSMLTPTTPARLYRGIVPISDHSVLFLGRSRMSNNFRVAEPLAIWATAFLDGHVKLPPLEELRKDVAYHNMFSRRRYPTKGGDGLSYYSEPLWYGDRLVCEAGLSSHRKDWWHDWNSPFMASDHKDCKDEYIQKYGLKRDHQPK